MEKNNILIVIPARAGSKGIPQKNFRMLNGKPLISYVLETCLEIKNDLIHICVTTNSPEVKTIAKNYYVQVIDRPNSISDDKSTLDPVIFHALEEMETLNSINYQTVITIQPTSPLLKADTLRNAIEYFQNNNIDTLISAFNKPHLSWTQNLDQQFIKNYDLRVNRQYLPKHLLETGAFLITKKSCISKNNRIGLKVSVFEVSEEEAIDIDSVQDWWVTSKVLSKRNIIIRVDGYTEIGLGHIYRSLILISNFIDHNVILYVSSKSDLGIKKIKESSFPFVVFSDEEDFFKKVLLEKPDILINDILNTNKYYMEKAKTIFKRVINFEDIGPGALIADAVINDLYDKNNNLSNYYWGSKYYLIRDEFKLAKNYEWRSKVSNILILFGGTDPSNLTLKVLQCILSLNLSEIQFTFILGIGYKNDNTIRVLASKTNNILFIKDITNISNYMLNADLAISSQGRTMLELASIGVPTIILAQNKRELTHEFGYLQNGFINLGHGIDVEETTIIHTLNWLINSPQIRFQMHKEMKKNDLKNGFENVKKIILGVD
jgi:CMP-N-acetylneuraminic acid synthetase/spore coat polysaccharide biosynthesis predicted glycosyltransferase SpsG